MDKYYYFVAQLPLLFFDKESFLKIDDFLEEGEKWLSQRDLAILKKVDINDTTICTDDPMVLKDYKKFEKLIRIDLMEWRKAKKINQEYKTISFPVSIIKDGNPLQVEENLMLLRWNFIEEIESDHHFDLDFIVLYYLKLQVLERLKSFDKEKGLEKFKQFTEIGV
ncbi:MAG: DUF2764 family protein [Candidatus Marinimicrobia bacterium]|nr:DUF2764 family protein [Candidatus Neomarinimicrobiota bacterium]